MNPNLLSLHQQQQLQQQQSIMSRFPSNIDAHLRPPGLRSSNFNHFTQAGVPNSSAAVNSGNAAAVQHQMQQIQQQQVVKAAVAATAATVARQGGNPKEVEMAQQDALRVTNPDLKRPFSSVEDAVNRLLPYHVVADYEAEEDDNILNNDPTGQVPSRLQQWDHNILTKIAEFTTTFEKQVLAFNIMSKKRNLGEFRSEERLKIEQLLLQDEQQAINDIKAENDSKERASREAAEAKMRMAMAQAEQARAQAQAQAQMRSRMPNPMRSSVIGSQGDGDMMHGWAGTSTSNAHANANINIANHIGSKNDEPAEDFLNDENEQEDEDDEDEDEGDDGELDLNARQ